MAHVVADRVKETTTTTGTGAVTLAGASTGYQAFSAACANNDTIYYCIQDGGSNWEVGFGTYSTTGPALARTRVIASSNAGSLVSFAAGSKDVFGDMPAANFGGVFNVKAFGALGNDSNDDTAAIQAAIDAASKKGGTVFFPPGTYKITAALQLYSGTTPTITAYSNITLSGCGSSGTNGSVIKQYTTSADCIKALNDVANGAQSTNVTLQDFCMLFGGATLTNSGNGLYMAQQAANGPSFQQWNLKNVVASNFQGSGKYGFNTESAILCTIDTCMAVTCANGFYLNGAAASAFSSVSTSVTYLNCYANMATNGVNGYRCTDNTYVSYIGCAVDIGANNTGSAYLVEGSSSISFYTCATELDGTHTLSQMWKIAADASSNASGQIGLYNCYGFEGKTVIDIYVTGSSTGVHIIGFQDNSAVSGGTGLKVDSGSATTELDCNWGTVATPRTIAGVNFILNDGTGNTTIGKLLTLPAGTATVQPLKYTSGSILTTPVAGVREYDGVAAYFTNETTSGRGLIPIEQYFKLTAAGTGITTIANFFGTTSNISLVSGAYYEIEIVCFFTMGATGSVVTWTLTNSAAPTYMDLEFRMSPVTGIVAPPGTTTELVGQIIGGVTAAQTIATASLTASTKQYAKFKIQLQNGTGTSLKIQATETTTTTALTPNIGSFWRCKRIPLANIGTFSA